MSFFSNYSVFFFVLFSLLFSCTKSENSVSTEKVVNLYSTRHYEVDKKLYSKFESSTGIKVNVVRSEADALIVRMKQEKTNPQADIFLTTNYPAMHRAVNDKLMEPFSSKLLLSQTSSRLRDSENFWYALSSRLRIIVVGKKFQGRIPDNYSDLANPEYKGEILMRSGLKGYNVSWVASLIAKWGPEKTQEYLNDLVSNFARSPEGHDRKQVSDIYAGKGNISLINSYYLGKMLVSLDPEESKASESVVIVYPKDGIHEDISGFSLIKGAKNKKNALMLLEFLTSEESQETLTNENYEYPVNPKVKPSDVFLNWGDLPVLGDGDLKSWGSQYELAIQLITNAGWK